MNKQIFPSAALLALLLASAPALAAAAAMNDTCINDYDILSTERPDDFTILFNMRHHIVYKNTLPSRCFGLRNEAAGFTYQPTVPGTQELCSNQMTIKLNTFGSFCLLGPFVRVK